jgi:hypothetical protein
MWGGGVSQVCGELKLLRILRKERREIVVIETHFLAIAYVFVCHGLGGYPSDEMLGSLCHDVCGLRRHNRNPARRSVA